MGVLLWALVVLSAWGILHTYLIFPIRLMAKYRQVVSNEKRGSKQDKSTTGRPAEVQIPIAPVPTQEVRDLPPGKNWPPVAMLMAVHNEEAVIAQKLEATLAQDYPGRLMIFVGCDNCSDQSWPILQDFARRFPDQVFASENPSRMGKPNTINRLFEELSLEPDLMLWLTDASVMPATDCLSQLVYPTLTEDHLVLVDAQQIHHGLQKQGISRSEDTYIGREARLKVAESLVYGHVIGPFGGCYTLQADFFRPVPSNFLVDDFFLCMSAYEAGGRGISSPSAKAYEAVGQSMEGEFRRKMRIATGNWQNLTRFKSLWWPPTSALAYSFFSHKVLRWISPMLALLMFTCLSILAFGLGNYWAYAMLYSLSALILIPSILDFGLSFLGVDLLIFRHWRYFLTMNLALLLGFFRFINGVQSNVWQPSQRHND
ncbi:MAG: glycosyltransferase [Bacteroidota bacterium]